MTDSSRGKRPKVQDVQEAERGKKPYHAPTLRVFGTVKQSTKNSGGTGTDGTHTGSEWIPV